MQSRDLLKNITSDTLIAAVENEDITAIERFVEFITKDSTAVNPSLETLRDCKGENILHQAIRKGNAEILKRILLIPGCHKLYDSVNDILADGKTRLMVAVENNDIPLVNLLLTVPGIDVNFGCHHEGGILLRALKSCSDSSAMLTVLTSHPGVDITLEDENGITAITYIFQHNKIDTIKKLLPLISDLPGFSFGLVNKAGKTAFMFLMSIEKKTKDCISSNNSKLKFLISQGVNVNVIDREGNAAIHYLMMTLHNLRNCGTLLICIEEFRDIVFNHKSIDLNLFNAQHETPLIIAVNKQNKRVVAALVKRGANVNCVDIHGRSLLEVLADLAKLVKIRYTESHKDKEIYLADCRLIESIVWLLMSAGIKPDVHALLSLSHSLHSIVFLEKVIFEFNNLFSDPYHILVIFEYLVKNNYLTIMQRLIEKFDSGDEKFNINAVSDGNTVLSYVVYTDHMNLLPTLLTIQSIDLNHMGIDLLSDPLKCRPLLHVAITRNNSVTLDAFLNDSRTDVNLCARGAGTPLIHAINENKADIASRLLDMPHVDVNCITEVRVRGKYKSTSVLSLALEKKQMQLAEEIINHPTFNVNNGMDHPEHLTPLMLTISSSTFLALKLLGMQGIDVNATGCISKTNLVPPLLFAIRNGAVEVVRALLTKPATNLTFRTPKYKSNILMQAISFDTCTTEMLEMLVPIFVAKGLLNQTNIKGETALHFAVRANKIDWVRLLLDAGITVDVYAKGQTAWQVAQRLGHNEMSSLILSHHRKHVETNVLTEPVSPAPQRCLTPLTYDPVWSQSCSSDVAPNSPHWNMFDDIEMATSKSARLDGEFTADDEAKNAAEKSLFNSISVAADVGVISQPAADVRVIERRIMMAVIQPVSLVSFFQSRPALPPYFPATPPSIPAASLPSSELAESNNGDNPLVFAPGK